MGQVIVEVPVVTSPQMLMARALNVFVTEQAIGAG